MAVLDAAPTPADTLGEPTRTLDVQPEVAQPVNGISVDPAEFAAAQEAVRRLEAHVASLTDEVTARRREVGQLHTLLAQANQRLLTVDQTGSSNGVSDDHVAQTQNADREWPERRSWWQRFVWG